MQKKCSIIAIIGLPNSGKSTLLNRLIGSKISIATPKAQTTRNQIRGILTIAETQLVFIDTPGILMEKPSSGQEKLQKDMMSLAWSGMQSAEKILFMVDSAKKDIVPNIQLVKKIAAEKIPKILVLNKIDAVAPEFLLAKIKEFNDACEFAATFMISATKGDGVEDLQKYLVQNAAPGPWIYAEDEITDAPSRFIAAEITREQIFMKFRQEIPYFSGIETEKWEEDEKRIHIHQLIYVTRETQKKIMVGSKGEGIKDIGMRARQEMQKFFGKKVNLFLFIKVDENWISRVNLNVLD